MNSRVATWEELGSVSGNVLLIVNSASSDTAGVTAIVEQLRRWVPPPALHVIAGPQWLEWLSAQGIARERILVAADAAGLELELNHFIESPAAVHWSLTRQFRIVVGTLAHSLHNDEIKTLFEQGACLLGRDDATFLAHALPSPFLYVLGADEFLERFSRDAKQATYEAATRAIVDDLHQLWMTRGRPGPEDREESTGAFVTVMTRLGWGLAGYDETAGPTLAPHRISASTRELVFHLRDVIRDHAEHWHELTKEVERLNSVVAERNAAVAGRDAINAEMAEERRRAVDLRDDIIDRLRERLEPLHRKVWRMLTKARR